MALNKGSFSSLWLGIEAAAFRREIIHKQTYTHWQTEIKRNACVAAAAPERKSLFDCKQIFFIWPKGFGNFVICPRAPKGWKSITGFYQISFHSSFSINRRPL